MVLLPNETDNEQLIINEQYLTVNEERVVVNVPFPLKTMSSGMTGSGVGWHRTFVNRSVSENYDCVDHEQDMVTYLKEHHFIPHETVSMMTAVLLTDVTYQWFSVGNLSVFIVVTASVGRAIDGSLGKDRQAEKIGTINTWLFVNGHLTDEAFIQSLTTATEAKVKVLHDLKITDHLYDTFATGTATDSILIAATQQGSK